MKLGLFTILFLFLIVPFAEAQNNLIPNPGFEYAKPGRWPQCDYSYSNNSSLPQNIQEDILYWNNGKQTHTYHNDYLKSTPDWDRKGFGCPIQPFAYSRHIYLEEHGAIYEDAIGTSFLSQMDASKIYVFKITYATGIRKSTISASTGDPHITVWFTKLSTHWSSNWGNVKIHFAMYPPGPNLGWVQHWHILNGPLMNTHSNIFNDLNNIVLDCSVGHAYIDYVELAENCQSPLLIENHQFQPSPNEIPYKSAGVLKAGYNVGNAQANGNVVVKSGATATFKAATQIFLEPGFIAESNSTFKTIIEPCDNTTARTIRDTIQIIDSKTIKIGDITIYDDSREVLPCDNDANEDGEEYDDSNNDNNEDYDVIIYGLDGDTTSFASYWWDFGNGETSTNPVAKIEFDDPGEYLVKLVLTDFSGVTDTLSKTYIKPDCDRKRQKISNDNFSNNISIYPNPNTGKFTIEMVNVSTNSLVEIYDIMGKKIWSTNKVNNKLTIDIAKQPKGIYLVKITTQNKIFTQKIIYQ